MRGLARRLARLFRPVILLLLAASTAPAQSSRPGWGSTPYADALGTGVTFRVWAPNASSVAVPGVFNGWSLTANPLVREGTNGVWSADISSARTGQEYKYYLNNGSCANGSSWRRDPRSRLIDCHNNNNSVIYNPNAFDWAGDNFTAPGLSDTVVYELHIGSFNSTNGANSGTFSNAIARLDQVQQLGVSAVEVMPIAEFPGASSWGYNPTDPFAADNCAYGGPDGFKLFVQACHQRGLAVLVDVVHNHYGPNNLDLWDFDCWGGGPAGGGIYFYGQTGVCCTAWGPRPNYGQAQVASFIQDSFRMWLDECHVDGFRWDTPYDMMYANSNNTTVFIPEAQSLIQTISSMIKTQYTGKLNIAENSGYVSGFDSQWSYPFEQGIVPQLTNTSDSQRSMSAVSSALLGSSPGWNRVIFMENHDTAGDLNGGSRLPAQISPATPTDYWARKRSTLGVALTLTATGIPLLLQGEEMLTTQQFGASNPLDWTRANAYAGILWLYKDLIRLRRNLDGLSSGLKGPNVNIALTDDTNKLLAYRRWNTGATTDNVLVVANFANATRVNYSINFPATGTWYAHFNSDAAKYSADYSNNGSTVVTATGSPAAGPVTIGPYSVLILSQVPPTPTPSTPAPVVAIAVSTNRINLSWPPVPGAAFYALKRYGTLICTTTSTNFSDTGLALGTAYCYTVAAVAGDSASPDSGAACASTFGPNTWVNPSSGKWETASNWSAGTPTQAGQWALFITNANPKTVTIDAVTTNSPGSLTISNLTLSAPAGATNTLLLTNSGPSMPLRVLSKLTVGAGGVISLTGAALAGNQAVNSNLIRADGSALSFSGNVTNNGNVRLINGSLWDSSGLVVNNGLIDLINGGLTNFHGGFINNGTVVTAGSVRITNVSLAAGTMTISLPSTVGHFYQLMTSASLSSANWQNVGPAQSGTGGALTFTDSGAVATQGFYRIAVSAQ
jgi:1,4-alpha-glucan branching enzyme